MIAFMSAAAPLVETTEERLRRELAQSSQAQARETLLREECARLRADNRALKRAEARRLAPPSAALYGPATGRALEGPLLTGGELAVASKERPRYLDNEGRRIEDLKNLKLVSKRFRSALKKNLIFLIARLKKFRDHYEMLEEKVEIVHDMQGELEGPGSDDDFYPPI